MMGQIRKNNYLFSSVSLYDLFLLWKIQLTFFYVLFKHTNPQFPVDNSPNVLICWTLGVSVGLHWDTMKTHGHQENQVEGGGLQSISIFTLGSTLPFHFCIFWPAALHTFYEEYVLFDFQAHKVQHTLS